MHVSPDPDLVTYWLADEIDERGYGLRGDTWQVMDALEAAGRPAWFRLGDRDLAMCLIRTEQLRAGRRLTEAHAAVVEALGVGARVLPMADEPVATRVRHGGRMLPFQEYMIVDGRRPAGGGRGAGRGRARPPYGRRARGAGRGGPDRDRPLQPGHLDRPDPCAARHARGARGSARAGRGGQPVRGRPLGEGSERALLRLGGHRDRARPASRAPTRTSLEAVVADEPCRRPARARDRHADGRPAGACGSWHERSWILGALWPPERRPGRCLALLSPSPHGSPNEHDRDPPREELRRREAASRLRARRRLTAGARSGDVLGRAGVPAARTRARLGGGRDRRSGGRVGGARRARARAARTPSRRDSRRRR